jgi:hypothetical protein
MLQVVELDVIERTENEMGAAKVVCVKELFSFIFKTTSFFDD